MTTPAERSARATLIALRSISRLGASQQPPKRTVIEPDPTLLSDEEAIIKLASMEKPAFCRGVSVGQVLHIEHLHVSPPYSVPLNDGLEWSEISFAEWVDRQAEEQLAGVRAAHGDTKGEIAIAVEGNSESVVLSITDFDRWCRDYVLWNAFGSSTNRVNPKERLDGATILHKIGPYDESSR